MFCNDFYLNPTKKSVDVRVCLYDGDLNLTVKVPHYSDLNSGFTALCGLLHQTAVINSLSLDVSHTTPSSCSNNPLRILRVDFDI